MTRITNTLWTGKAKLRQFESLFGTLPAKYISADSTMVLQIKEKIKDSGLRTRRVREVTNQVYFPKQKFQPKKRTSFPKQIPPKKFIAFMPRVNMIMSNLTQTEAKFVAAASTIGHFSIVDPRATLCGFQQGQRSCLLNISGTFVWR
jgi:hypothetical protein